MYARRVVLGFSLASALVCGQGTTPIRPAQQAPYAAPTGEFTPPRCEWGVGVLIGGAPNAAPTTDSATPKKPGVEGVVTNSVNGRPVKKAKIRLGPCCDHKLSDHSGVSDLAGHFLFENVQPGKYTATVVADGFMPGSWFLDESFAVAEGQHVDMVLELVPLASVGGRVLDQDGDPIAGAGVQVLVCCEYVRGRKEMRLVRSNGAPLGHTNSNDLGEFQIVDLLPGRYYFGVTAPSPQASITGRSRGVEETYPVTYYPSALDWAHATSVEVIAGAQLSNIDFRVRKIRTYSVRGKVVDASGQGRGGGVTFFSPGFDDTMYTGRSVQVQQDGSFQMRGVGSGSYTLIGGGFDVIDAPDTGPPAVRFRGAAAGKALVRLFARQSIKVSDQDLDGVLLVLAPGLEITGTVQVEGSKASPMPENLDPQLTLDDGMGHIENATVANGGTFVLHHDVMQNLYQFSVGLVCGKYLKSIRFNGSDVSSGQIDLTHQSGGTLSVVFGRDGGRIEGSVQGKNGAPAANVAITVAPVEGYEGRRDLFRGSHTDQRGNFGIPDIAPGKYKIFAWEQYDSMTMQAPEFRKLFESRAATVSVGPNGRESVKLKIISAEDIQAQKSKLP